MKMLASPLTAGVFAVVSFLCLTLVALAPASARGDDTDREIQDIILSQIEAFANDDRDAAWAFASEGIRRQSGSVDTFYDMVRLSYAPIHQAASVEFMDRIPHPGFQIQVVHLRGPEGGRWRALYRMVRNDDQWRIGGVTLKQAPGTI